MTSYTSERFNALLEAYNKALAAMAIANSDDESAAIVNDFDKAKIALLDYVEAIEQDARLYQAIKDN